MQPGERSIQCSNKCILNNLEQRVLLCISSFLANNTDFKQDRGQDKKNNFNNIMLAELWYPILSMFIRKPVILPLSEKLLTNPSGQTHPLVTNQTLTKICFVTKQNISDTDGFKGYLFEKGVSVKAANLTSNSRRHSSLSGYESSWKKWSGWYDRRAVNPFQCALASILDYLTSFFEVSNISLS